MPFHPRRDATATAPAAHSPADELERRGLSILDAAAWRQQSPFSWVYGTLTICAVCINGVVSYELWRNSAFVTRADDPQTLRTVAAAGSDAA